MNSDPISRRTVLRGIGTAMALPLLEGMAPLRSLAGSLAAPAPVRLAFLFVPNGMKMDDWTPTEVGAMTKLPAILEPLSDVKESFNILTGLAQHNAFALGDGPGDHARSTATWLTGVHIKKTSGADIRNGISADQVAASEIGHHTRFASLEIGCERGAQSGDCDSGYSCAYSSSIAWKGEAQPLAKEVNPRLVFERLFGSGDGSEAEENRTRRARDRKSILDFVMDDAKQLGDRLGSRDKQKLDEYLTGIREIEERLIKAEKDAGHTLVDAARPKGIPRDYAEHIRLMGDMMILAFQTDATRICTFMFANDGSNRSYSQIGIADGHHDVSHHGRDTAKLEKKRQIDRYHVEQLAYILNRMKAIREGNGTLLDNTLLVYGAGIGDGDRHNHDDLPILVAGSAGGSLKTGRHLQFNGNTPMNNLFLSMLDRVGVKVEKLGDSTGKLQGLF